MTNVICDPLADHGDVPEPDWEMLMNQLRQASDWLRGEEATGMPSLINATEAIDTFIEVLDMTLARKSFEAVAWRWIDRVQWAAYWLAGMKDDPALRERLHGICGDPDKINRQSADAGEPALADMTPVGSA